jgi:hypothetical protein
MTFNNACTKKSYILTFSRMNCVSSTTVGSKCTFATDRLAILERTMSNYMRMRTATLVAMAADKIESRFVADDVAAIDRKIKDTASKMITLRQCTVENRN